MTARVTPVVLVLSFAAALATYALAWRLRSSAVAISSIVFWSVLFGSSLRLTRPSRSADADLFHRWTTRGAVAELRAEQQRLQRQRPWLVLCLLASLAAIAYVTLTAPALDSVAGR